MASKDDMDVDTDEVTIASSDVIEKYKTAATIANAVLAAIVKECTPGKKIIDLCVLGDKLITEKLSTFYSKGKTEKGMAFPVSISVNNCVGHFSPLPGDVATLNDGDVAKIDLGVHVDGFISLVAHTVIVSESQSVPNSQPVTGRKADVINAAYYAAEVAHRLIKPGKKNTDVTAAIRKIADIFKCEPVEGVLSHEMKRFVVDGNKVIINKPSLEHKVDEFEFKDYEVYAVDIVMSTGDGKAKESELRTTIYKRAVDQTYQLKMQASRYVISEINKNFPTLPFPLRALDEKRGKLGITECLKHDLVYPYPVLFEKAGEYVAQFKFTVLVTPNGTQRLNMAELPTAQSEHKINDPEIDTLLKSSTKRTKKNKKKKSATGDADTKAPEGDAMDTDK